jgi:hypothetical protein
MTVQHVTLQIPACDKIESFFLKTELSQKTYRHPDLPIYRLPTSFFFGGGPIEERSVQKYTPHNRTTEITLYAKRFKPSTSTFRQ